MVTIIMPAYNEAEIIEASVREWYKEVLTKLPGAELLVVDDCSKDATSQILEGLAETLPGVRWVRPAANGGHGKALRFGFQHAFQEYVFQTDSDRQHMPSDFWRVWERRHDHDFVFGVRASRADGGLRRAITGAMRLCNLLLWGIWIRDANCPFKLMRRTALEAVLVRIPEDSFIPMVMVSVAARKRHYRFCEVEVEHLPRRGGQQSLKGLWKWTRVTRNCVLQLLQWRLSSDWDNAAPQVSRQPAPLPRQ